MNNLLSEIYKLYEKEVPNAGIHSGLNSSKDNFAGIWQVGDLYSKQDKRLLFIGKTARGGYSLEEQPAMLNVAAQLWVESSWAFWTYTKSIVQTALPGDSAELANFSKIAITNLIKTNDWIPGKPTTDQTTPEVAEYWIKDHPLFREEMKILNPTHTIIYAGKQYLDAVMAALDLRDITVSFNRTVLAVGSLSDGGRVIITRHPERAPKVQFVADVIAAL